MVMGLVACTSKPDPEPEPFEVLKYPFTTVVSQKEPEKTVSLALVENETRTILTNNQWTEIPLPNENDGALRLTLKDAHNDLYRLYLPKTASNYGFAIVTRSTDQVKFGFMISVGIIAQLENLIEPLLADPVDPMDDYEGYFYFGDPETYDESKLFLIEKGYYSHVFQIADGLDTYPYTEAFDPMTPIRFIFKDHTGTYLTVYQPYVIEGEYLFVATIGDSPLGGPETDIVVVPPHDIHTLENLLVYREMEGADTFDALSVQIETATMLQFMEPMDYTLETVSRPYSGAMKDFIDGVLQGTWTRIEDVNEEQVRIRIKLDMTDGGVIYLAPPYTLILDEDPTIPGALYYTNTAFNLTETLLHFAYTAHVTVEVPDIVIATINLYDPDAESQDLTYITLTPTQSATLTSYLKPSTWVDSFYGFYEFYGWDQSKLIIQDSLGYTYWFDYASWDTPDQDYVMVFGSRLGKSLLVPMNVFLDLLSQAENMR
jgi:hypothetical protein